MPSSSETSEWSVPRCRSTRQVNIGVQTGPNFTRALTISRKLSGASSKPATWPKA